MPFAPPENILPISFKLWNLYFLEENDIPLRLYGEPLTTLKAKEFPYVLRNDYLAPGREFYKFDLAHTFT